MKSGETILRVYADDDTMAKQAIKSLQAAIAIGSRKPKVPKLIRERI